MFENSDLYRMNWRKRYFDAFSCYRTQYTFIWRAGEHSYHKLQVIFQQCETMGSCLLNFLLIRVKLLIWWDFCRFFKVLLEQLLKFLLRSKYVINLDKRDGSYDFVYLLLALAYR